MTDDVAERTSGLRGVEDVTDHSEHPHAYLPNRIRNLAPVGLATMAVVFGGIVTSGLLSIGLFIFGLVILLYGGYLVLSPPTYRFEVGTYRASHQYDGVEITAEVEIRYDDEEVKRRTVECAALDEDGTMITRESDTEPVGTKPDSSLDGGDFDGVQSTSDHILAVTTPVHEYVDEWLAAEGNDLEIKTTLETEFDTTGSERERAIAEERNQ